jgi:hypothetical protein
MRTDGAYAIGWNGFATLCTDEAPCRVTDPAIVVRSHYTYALLEGAQLFPPVPWLQVGVNRKVTYDGDEGELSRLNRRMVGALGRGTALSTELFALAARDLIRLMQRRNDPREFQKFDQFHGQSWSVLEFLCGEEAPEERRAALRSLLNDRRLKTHQEESFRKHFGLGFDALLDDWRKWVLDQGIGAYDPPSPRVHDALLNRVIPLVRDRKSRREDRILAIRELGGQGYLLGADALIELLRDGGEIPREEVVWALSMISGLAGDDDPDRWQDWLITCQ